MDTIQVVNEDGLLHLINEGLDGVTDCGMEYDDSQLQTRSRGDAGVWCMDCMGAEFERVDGEE